MTPTKHQLCNDVLLKPVGSTEEECSDLPICRLEQEIISFWRPTPDELRLIAMGEPIAVMVMGQTHPPIFVTALDMTKTNLPQ